MMIQKGAMLDAFLKFPNCSCLKEPIFSFILANADFSYGDLSEAFACENIYLLERDRSFAFIQSE